MCVCLSVPLLIRKYLFLFKLFTYTLYIHVQCACLCFWQGGMDYGVNFGPEACAFRIWAEHFSLWQDLYIICIVNLHFCLPVGGTWAQHLHETASAVNKNGCRIATQTYKSMLKKQHLHSFPCAKPWAALARNLRDAGFRLPKSSQQTRLVNFKRKVLEWPPYTYTYVSTYYLSGWWFEPLWKILVSWDYYSQYMEK